MHLVAANSNPASAYGNLFITTNTALAADIGGSISLGGYYDTFSSIFHWAAIKGGKENATANNLAGYLSFFTVPSSTGTATERVRITSGGDVYINSTSNFYWQNTNARLGLKQSSPTSTLHVTGSVAYAVTTTASGITLDETHYIVLVTGTVTITLPAASGCTGRTYVIKNALTGPGTVTVGRTGTDTIDGTTSLSLAVANKTTTVVSDGSNWRIIAEYDGTV
jgi:hypothetical protein